MKLSGQVIEHKQVELDIDPIEILEQMRREYLRDVAKISEHAFPRQNGDGTYTWMVEIDNSTSHFSTYDQELRLMTDVEHDVIKAFEIIKLILEAKHGATRS